MKNKMLYELRKERGLSQNELANILGIDRQTYHRYENGITNLNVDILIKAADYYNVTTDYLLNRQNRSPEFQEIMNKINKLTVREKILIKTLINELVCYFYEKV